MIVRRLLAVTWVLIIRQLRYVADEESRRGSISTEFRATDSCADDTDVQ